ncbi:MAG: PLP-dependent aminotransferase family protein [Alphaproteobacteria bacterium]
MPATTLFAVGLDAKQPHQRQVNDQQRALHQSGRAAGGARLPSTRALAAELSVSRNTVAAAYDQLLAEGFLVGRVGSGSYVAPDLPRPDGSTVPRKARARAAGPSRRGAALAALAPAHGARARAFMPGLPAIDEFPFALWSRLLARAWRSPQRAWLAHGDPAGLPELRASIAAHLGAMRGVRCEAQQVLVVSGSQAAIALAARVLLDPGDVALIEDPVYPGLTRALAAEDVAMAPAPIDAEGLDIAVAARIAPKARMACVTPSHQYPLGHTMSLARRVALLDWAARNGAWVLEDDYDSEFRYRGRPLASLQGLDQDGRVVYVGSFSKVMFPALRVAYLVAPLHLVDAFHRARAALEDHPSTIAQPALARFMEEGHFVTHLGRMRRLYAARQAALLESSARHLGGLLDVAPDPSGMHLVGYATPALRRRMTDREGSARAAARGITAQPLSSYYRGRVKRQGFLLGYAAHSEREIERGVKMLAEVLGKR